MEKQGSDIQNLQLRGKVRMRVWVDGSKAMKPLHHWLWCPRVAPATFSHGPNREEAMLGADSRRRWRTLRLLLFHPWKTRKERHVHGRTEPADVKKERSGLRRGWEPVICHQTWWLAWWRQDALLHAITFFPRSHKTGLALCQKAQTYSLMRELQNNSKRLLP